MSYPDYGSCFVLTLALKQGFEQFANGLFGRRLRFSIKWCLLYRLSPGEWTATERPLGTRLRSLSGFCRAGEYCRKFHTFCEEETAELLPKNRNNSKNTSQGMTAATKLPFVSWICGGTYKLRREFNINRGKRVLKYKSFWIWPVVTTDISTPEHCAIILLFIFIYWLNFFYFLYCYL